MHQTSKSLVFDHENHEEIVAKVLQFLKRHGKNIKQKHMYNPTVFEPFIEMSPKRPIDFFFDQSIKLLRFKRKGRSKTKIIKPISVIFFCGKRPTPEEFQKPELFGSFIHIFEGNEVCFGKNEFTITDDSPPIEIGSDMARIYAE